MKALVLSVLLASCATVSTTVPYGCLQPIRIGEDWNEFDEQQAALSQKKCRERFGPTSCVVRITKLGDNTYTVKCSRGDSI